MLGDSHLVESSRGEMSRSLRTSRGGELATFRLQVNPLYLLSLYNMLMCVPRAAAAHTQTTQSA